VSILQEYPSPDEVGEMMTRKGNPRISSHTWLVGPDDNRKQETGTTYTFDTQSGVIVYNVESQGGKIASIGVHIMGSGLRRGLPFEVLKKIYLDALIKYFGSPPEVVPAEVWASNTPFPEQWGDRYVWKARLKGGLIREISFRCVHTRTDNVPPNGINIFYLFYHRSFLWNKPYNVDAVLSASFFDPWNQDSPL
jgi:hypothetical protein